MPSQRNIQQLAVLKEKLEKAASGVFVDHSGLKVSDQQVLRAKLREVDGDFLVAKNTLLSLALEQIHNAQRTTHNALSGPTSLVLSYQDEILPIKILAEFSKAHEKPTIKAGFLGEKPLTKEEVLMLANLPGKDELIGMLMARLQSPAYGLVNVLSGNIRKLVYALQAISKRVN